MNVPSKFELELTVDWLMERLLRHENMQTLTALTIPPAVIGVLIDRSERLLAQRQKEERIARRQAEKERTA